MSAFEKFPFVNLILKVSYLFNNSILYIRSFHTLRHASFEYNLSLA
jgi:hypothetical protein